VADAADTEPVRVRDPAGDQQVNAAEDIGPFAAADRARDRRREVMAVALAPRGLGKKTAYPAVASHCPGAYGWSMSMSA